MLKAQLGQCSLHPKALHQLDNLKECKLDDNLKGRRLDDNLKKRILGLKEYRLDGSLGLKG